MEEENFRLNGLHAHACSKSELAQRYLPHITSAAARSRLRSWIEESPELKSALLKTGYRDKAVILTPAQVQVFYDVLGMP